MMLPMKCFIWLTLYLALCVILPVHSQPRRRVAKPAATTYECKPEDFLRDKYCVFRNVEYNGRNAIAFKAPSSKVQQVAFVDSNLKHIPMELLTAFPEMRALYAVNCSLTTVIIPKKLERLHASKNSINKVIVLQDPATTTMIELVLDSNRLQDISNITRPLKKLEVLNLSDNKQLTKEKAIELGWFARLKNLRQLLLANVGVYYIDNARASSLPELQLLDLSNNDLITSNLDVGVFAPLHKLESLRLAHNQLTNLDALELTQNNKLKEIYLEGNDFTCDFQALLVKHLVESGIEYPVEHKNVECMQGYWKRDNMCCRSGFLDRISL
ncbi:phospholipase A2 inhibitor-like isoform X2 [Anopheles albimanus]|uniref:phospholipase A2 inhibitor-like isoform X2 n=1 Tax=Anopheles albimanus TaxID=7167 RepID=UPI0016404E89|nr:phospholipase A2 inhibitor-like isoform X2 [Anopheles albimanus]